MNKRLSLLVLILLLASTSLCALDLQPKADYRARRVALAEKAKGMPILLFAAEEPADVRTAFRQDDDFFYLTGWTEPGAALLIAPAGKKTEGSETRPYSEFLFLPGHNARREKYTGVKLGPENPKAPEITGFDHVASLDQMRDELVKVLGTERRPVMTKLSGSIEESPAARPLEWLIRANAFADPQFSDITPLLAEMRVCKDNGEIERIRHATDASMAAHRAAFKTIKPGMTELQVEALMRYEFMSRGCEHAAYPPIVGSGANSTVLHYEANSATVQGGDLVVMDVAGDYAMYASDITRTVPASGKFTPRQREIYDIVLGAQRAAQQAFRSGKSTLIGDGPDSLYRVAFDYINTHGKDLHGQPLGKYFIHGLGHFVGLSVHDVGGGPLGPGAVFTIEPGIYIPEEKIGVRIEDIYWVDRHGNLNDFTANLPHTADEVEAAMRP